MMKFIGSVIFFLLIFSNTFSQPSDAKVKSDAVGSGNGILSFKFTKSTGTRQWNSSIGNWEYVRGVVIKRKSEYPDINLIVNEDIVYQYTGSGNYSYWKVRVIENEYEGIPNPTAKEIQDFISKNWARFYGNYYYTVITKIHEQPVLADTPRWIWHSPSSVSFKMKLKFDYIVFNKGIETQQCIWDVRLYRDNPKAAWNNILALRSEEDGDFKIINFKNYTPQQLEDFKKQTIQYTLAEQQAKKAIEALPQINLPAFANEEAMAKYLHQQFITGTPEKVRAVFLQVMHPGFFENGSKVQLQAVQEQNLNQTFTAACINKIYPFLGI